ncbi:mucin-2-like isoform X2 [Daphnia carinata]|uniref:mucin-2-like isoform X2 n=1 Tax=Daphnia carinata TaxID=120202 RepID=UPI00257AA2B9|nr:mucin-2-like isoform X2 [Daphnia carinata]
MAKDEKLGKWVEAMTPRHAIENFFDHATLVDSPDPEELYKSSLSSGLIKIPESTPLAKSPQSSQRSGWKRKSDHEEQYDGNGSKRNNVEEIDMSSSDSVSDTLVFPSNLESPHLVIPQKTELKIKKRMSVSAFTKAIHSQEPQESSVTMNESSIASTLGSPDEALSRRPRRLKNNTSVSDFAETLGKKVEKKIIKDDSSNMENTSVLSHLDSLEHISYEKRGTGVEKKRASSTGFKSILNKRSFQIGELSEDESTDHSTTPSAMLTEQYAHSKNSRLSPAFESMLSIPVEAHSQIEKTSSKIGSDAPSSNNSDSELYEGMPDLESPDDFSSPGSTIQVINRNSSGLPEVSKHLQNSIREKNETIPPDPFVSQNGKNLASASVSNSTYDVPSVLGSPQEYQEYYRPGHMPSKKKVSVTGFLATLSQTVDLQSRKSSNRSSTSKTSKRTSIEATGELLRQNTPSPMPEQLRRVTRSSSQAFDKTIISPKTTPRKTPTLESKHSGSDESARQFVNKSSTDLVMQTDEMPQNPSQIPSVEDDFSSSRSTIQVTNRKSSELLESLAADSVSNSTSDVPSVLGSPQEYQEYYRPGHMQRTRSQKKVSVTGFLATLSQTVQSQKSPNRSSTSKASIRTSIGNVSEETGELLRQNTPSPLPEQLRRVTRSSSQAIDKTFVSPKTNPRKSPTLKLKHSESDESAHQLVNRSLTALVTEMDVIPQNSRQMSKRSSMADYRIIEHTEAEGSHSDKAVGIPLNVTPSKLTHEKREASRSSSRITNRSSVTSKPNPKSILHPELDGQVTKDSEDILPMQMKTSLSVTEIASPILAPIEARASSVLLSPKRQIRKSLNFSTPIIKDSSAATTPATEDGLPPIDEVEIEETPPTDVDSMEEDKVFEDDPAIEGIEKQAEAEDDHLSPKTATRSSHELNQFTRKSSSMQMTSANRYPALKNSTIVAGGSAFAGVTLSMSPIVPDKQGAPLRVPSSPKLTTPESPKTVAQFSETKEKSTPPKNLHRTPSHPSTPAPFGRKRTRSLTQSPMFMNVMKSTVQKAVSKTVKDQQQSVPIVASPGKNATTPKQVPSVKGLSLSNTKKGKSIALSAFDEMQDSSDTEWEDMEDNLKPKPACIKIAFEEIPDRSKDFVPFEERLMADPIFQAKMSLQQAKLASQKAAEEAAAAAKKATTKRKPRIIKKKEEDNIASVATNKGNFRFYARTKVTKDALEVVHGLVGEWFDFTLRQVEKYCIDEGKASLDTWEDCYKVLKRQGLVSDYVEYSGLCHDLLLNDECDQLLPTRPPPEYAEWRREAQKREK